METSELILLQPGRPLPSTDGKSSYTIKSQIKIGANGISYEAIRMEDDQRVFIKTPKVTKDSLSDVDIYKDLAHKFKEVFRRSKRLSSVEGVAEFIAVEYFNESDPEGYPVAIPFTVHQFVNADSLYDYKQKNASAFSDITAVEWFKTAKRLVTVVKEIHNAQVAHGNISPLNIQRDEQGRFIIVDFAEACLVDVEWRKDSKASKDHCSDPYTAPERTRGSWDFAADIFSIGGVLYYLACGEDPPLVGPATSDHENDVAIIKKGISDGLKKTNPQLLKENPGIAKIIDKCRRSNPNERYPYPENILSHIEIFNNEQSVDIESFKKSSVEVVGRIQSSLDALIKGDNFQFSRILYPELLLLEKHINGMAKGNHEIIGDREDLIDSLLRYLSLLKKGDRYYTLTTPTFWSASNLGINGRFLTMNMVMAMRGVAIRRIFLLTKEETTTPNVTRILEAHQEATEHCAINVPCDDNGYPMNDDEGYFTGFAIEEEAKRKQLIEDGYHTGLLRFKSKHFLSLNFMTRADNVTIGKVRFWASQDGERLLREFASRKPTPISEIVPKSGEHSKFSYAQQENDIKRVDSTSIL